LQWAGLSNDRHHSGVLVMLKERVATHELADQVQAEIGTAGGE